MFTNLKTLSIITIAGLLTFGLMACSNVSDKESKESEAEVVEETTEQETEVHFEEKPVEIDYTADTEEILAKYTEEGMKEFKMNFPDTLTMEYALRHIGKEAIDIAGKTMSGESVSLAELKGKNVVISFSKTTCSICKEMIPVMEKVKEEHKDVVFFNVFPVDENKAITSFYKDAKTDVPTMTLSLEDNKQLKEVAVKNYEINQVPTYVFVDKRGKISYTYIGNKDEVLFDEMIDRAFGEEKLYEKQRTVTIQVDENGKEVTTDSDEAKNVDSVDHTGEASEDKISEEK